MDEILRKSRSILKIGKVTLIFWLVCVLSLLIAIILISSNSISTLISIIIFLLLSLIFFICGIIEFIKEIILFFEIRKQYDGLIITGRDNSVSEYEFEILFNLKKTMILTIIFVCFLYPASFFTKYSYKKKIKEIEKGDFYGGTVVD